MAITANSFLSLGPEGFHRIAYGELRVCEPAQLLPMAQHYFLF